MKKNFTVKKPFTLRSKPVKAGDTVTGSVEEFKNLINKGYLELASAAAPRAKAAKPVKK
jgi:acyl dehydratase